jgi:hypothetical protein
MSENSGAATGGARGATGPPTRIGGGGQNVDVAPHFLTCIIATFHLSGFWKVDKNILLAHK